MAQKFIHTQKTAIVETTKGTVRGFELDHVSIFKGIPYAKAKRFHAPVPVDPWEGVFDATSFGCVCPLRRLPKPAGELFVPHRYWVMDENCQNLNIWTPGCDKEKRPVLVWLHGGGYEEGSAIEHLAYEGENMARRGQVVVISINHRLNVLGYCDLSAFGEEYANSGNAGMDDIIAALQWIRDNIAAFGGDPDNVTLFGQSGGGAKITTLLQMPAADGLFAKGINMSGVIGGFGEDVGSRGELLGETMMEMLGVSTVKELETVPYQQLADAFYEARPQLIKDGHYVGGMPVRNEFMLGDPANVGFRAESAKVPLLVGSVYGEFFAFNSFGYDRNHMTQAEGEEIIRKIWGEMAADELLPAFKEAYPNRNPIDLLTVDTVCRPAIQNYVRNRAKGNQATYSYLFNLDLPLNGGTTPWHCIDIPYVFGNTSMVAATQEEGITERLEEEIFNRVIAFAKTGDPNCEGLPRWEACTPESEPVLVVDRQSEVKNNYDVKLMELLKCYPKPEIGEQGQIQH